MEAAPITPKMLAAVKPGETLTVSIDPVEAVSYTHLDVYKRQE